MKYLAVALIYGILLAGFIAFNRYTTFKIDDCFGGDSGTESWEDKGPIWQIQDIGHYKVKVRMYERGRWLDASGSYPIWCLHFDRQISCPSD